MGREDSEDESSGLSRDSSFEDPDSPQRRQPAAAPPRVPPRWARVVATDEPRLLSGGATAGAGEEDEDSAGSTDTVELDRETEEVLSRHGSRNTSRASSLSRCSGRDGGSEADFTPGDDAARRSPPAIVAPVGRRGLVTGRGMPTSPPDVKIEVASSFAPPHSLVSGAAGRAGIVVQRRGDRGVGISSVGSDSGEAEPGDVRKGMNGRGNDYRHPKTTFTQNVVSDGAEAQSLRASTSDTRYESPGDVGSSEEETTAVGGDKVPANGGGARLPSRNRELIGNGLINYSAFPERLAPAPEASRSSGVAAIALTENGEPLEALAQDEAPVASLKVATRYDGDHSPALPLSALKAGWGMRKPASHQRASRLAAREGDAGWEIGAAALEEDGDVRGVESGEREAGSGGSAGGLREDEDNDGEEWAEATQQRMPSPCGVVGMVGLLVVVAAVGCLLAFGGTCLREGHAHWMCVDMSEGGGYLMVGGALFLAACAVCCCGCALCVQEQTVRDSSEGIVSAGDNSGALAVGGGSEREVGARAIGAVDPGGYVADIQDFDKDI